MRGGEQKALARKIAIGYFIVIVNTIKVKSYEHNPTGRKTPV